MLMVVECGMNWRWRIICSLALSFLLFAPGRIIAAPLHNFVFFGRDRQRIAETVFLKSTDFEGAQLTYTWKQLESREDGYDFADIESDLAVLSTHGKGLFIQIQDATFDTRRPAVPLYLTKNPRYNGGAVYQYDDKGVPEGWVARRWDPAVRERFQKLLRALGKSFDGRVEGVNLQETAIGVTETGPHAAAGFTYSGYRDSILSNMRALKTAFPRSVTVQYANFMPGEWLPGNDRSFLYSIFEYGYEIGVGIGAPDLLPDNVDQRAHVYRFMQEFSGKMAFAVAVQDGNYTGQTGVGVKPAGQWTSRVPKLYSFAYGKLGVAYIFWGAQEPYFSHDVVPFFQNMK
jgi:hypothetical protein